MFDRLSIGMCMPRQVIGAYLSHIQYGDRLSRFHTDISRFAKMRKTSILRDGFLRNELPSVALNLYWQGCDPHRRIVEQGNLSVRMTHRLEPGSHPSSGRYPRRRNRPIKCAEEIYQILLVFEDEQVIQRAALEMTAVGEHLLRQLFLQYLQPLSEPCRRLIPFEKKTGKNERLGIDE